MFLVVTRNFPPDVGGMQTLMGGLSESLINHGPVKVFTYEFPNSGQFDNNSELNVERIGGIKLFRKYRKANLINEFISSNSNIRAIFADHWKSLELLNENYLDKSKTFCLLHSKEINHDINSSLNKRLIKATDKADFIIANSNFTKELAIKVGINPKKISEKTTLLLFSVLFFVGLFTYKDYGIHIEEKFHRIFVEYSLGAMVDKLW